MDYTTVFQTINECCKCLKCNKSIQYGEKFWMGWDGKELIGWCIGHEPKTNE